MRNSNSSLRKSVSEVLDEGTYHQVNYRWVVFGVYMLAALVNSLPTQTFSSINSLVSQRFQYSKTVVTMNTLFFPISHPLIAVPVNWVLDKFGMAKGCFGGGLFLIVGVWLRTFIAVKEPAFVLVGSIFAAIGNIFILNSPTILATNWFKPQSVPGIISLTVLANLVSVGLGASLPGLILKKQSSAEQIQSFLRVQAMIISIPIIIMMIFLRNKPEIPPSKSAGKQNSQKQKYAVVLKKLFTNKEYIKIMVAMVFSYGTLTSYLAILDQSIALIDKSVDSGQVTAQVAICAMFTGIIATPFFVNRIKVTLQYRLINMVVMGLTFINFTLVQIAICLKQTGSLPIIPLSICVGFFVVPSTALLIAYGSECTYPLGEGSSAGYLFAASQTFGFLLGLGSISLIENAKSSTTSYVLLIIHSLLYLISFIALFLSKQTLNRTNFQIESQHLLPSQDEILVKSTN